MADNCLFCGIIEGSVPSRKVREDDESVAFHDINPQAPTHVLVVPKKHVVNLADCGADAEAGMALLRGIKALVDQEGLTDYRTVFNTGPGVGQSVFHVHAHVLSGRPMGWPPG